MIMDQRLQNMTPSVKKYHAEQERQALLTKQKLSTEEWAPLVAWLETAILAQIVPDQCPASEKPSFVGMDQSINNAAQSIYVAFTSNETRSSGHEIEYIVLDELLGKKLAETVGHRFVLWEPIGLILEYYPRLYAAWKKELPIDTIKRHEGELFQLPVHQHPLELTETWGVWRDRQLWPRFDEEQQRNRTHAKDSWDLVQTALDFNNELEFRSVLRFRGDLLLRGSETTWLRWVAGLPLLQMQAAAIGDIRDLAFIVHLVSRLLDEPTIHERQREILLVMILRHSMALWDQIYSNLNHWSNNNWVSNEEDRAYQSEMENERDNWTKHELPKTVQQLVEQLRVEQGGIGRVVAMTALLHLKVIKANSSAIQLREALAQRLSQLDSVPALIGSMLEQNAEQTAILSSMLILFAGGLSEEQFSQTKDRIWEGYSVWLQSQNFYWSGNLQVDSDEHNLAWMLGGILSSCSHPFQKLTYILKLIQKPHEGWRFDSKNYYKSRDSVAHVLVVGAMASEWMIANKLEGVIDFYKCLWEIAHKFVRQRADDHSEVITTLLIQIWARLKLVLPVQYLHISLQAVGSMDYLKHIMLCLQVLLNNLRQDDGKAQLDIELQKIFQSRFNQLLPLIRARYQVTDEDINWYLSEYIKLTPNVPDGE